MKLRVLLILLLVTSRLVQGQTVDTVLIWNNISNAIELVEVRDSSAVEVSLEAFELAQESGNINLVAEAANVYAEALAAFNGYDDQLRVMFDELMEADRTLDYEAATKCLINIGKTYMRHGDNHRALIFLNRAVLFASPLNNVEVDISLYNRIGVVYKNIGDFENSLKFYQKALDVALQENDVEEQANAFLNMGVLFHAQNDIDKSRGYYESALDLFLKAENANGEGDCYNNLGVLFKASGDYDMALEYYQKALSMRDSTGNDQDKASALHNIGYIQVLQGDYEQGLDTYFAALEIKERLDLKLSAATTYLNIAEAYGLLGQNQKAEEYFEIALALAYETGSNTLRSTIYFDLSNFYANAGSEGEAYRYLQMHMALNDSLFSSEKVKLISDLDAVFWAEKQAVADSLALAEQLRLNAEKVNSQSLFRKTVSFAALVAGVFALLFAWSVYRRYKTQKQANAELEKKHKELEETRISKEEKEVLLQEVHHRVKNNLQIINSLIRLQADQLDNDESVSVLRESQNRISSMALVHEELYQAKDFANVNVNNYITNLVNNVALSFGVAEDINTSVVVSVPRVELNTLIPVGLIINEVISNSFKHAFPNGQKDARVFLELKEENGKYVLIIGDNGIGLDRLPDLESTSLGMELIQTLVEQVDGEMVLNATGGLVYHITFAGSDS